MGESKEDQFKKDLTPDLREQVEHARAAWDEGELSEEEAVDYVNENMDDRAADWQAKKSGENN